MIRRTQENLGMLSRGTGDPDISMPDFSRVAQAFDIPAVQIRTWQQVRDFVPVFMESKGPALLEVITSPQQPLLKLNPSKNADGTIHSPKFWDLTFKAAA